MIRNISKDAGIVFDPVDLGWAQVGAAILVNGDAIGNTGIISKKIREKFDIKEISPCAAEIDFEQLMGLSKGTVKVKPIPRFPSVQRDLSLIVDEGIRWTTVVTREEDG